MSSAAALPASRTGETGQTVTIAASVLFFAALTSAMVVRRGLGPDWAAPELPVWIWPTVLLGPAASRLVRSGRNGRAAAVAGLLPLLQLALLPPLVLARVGDAFFAVQVCAHAAHAAAGALALARFGVGALRFWHFAGFLWAYILLLFGVWA